MSIDRCTRCSRPVDTDEDSEAHVDVGNMRGLEDWVCVCESCRDEPPDDLVELDIANPLEQES